MAKREPDPLDLLVQGKYQEATKKYLELYLEALTTGDRFIGVDLLTPMHFSVAKGEDPEASRGQIEQLIIRGLRERRIPVNDDLRQVIEDDLNSARSALESSRKRTERSIRRVDTEKETPSRHV
jgi:hypothetical protein